MYKNVGFVREVKRFFVHFFSLKKGGGEFFIFWTSITSTCKIKIVLEIIDLDSTCQELSIDILHDIVFPTRF